MQGTTLIEQGFTLMLVGMGTVFMFLSALVLAMTVMAQVVKRLVPRPEAGITDEEVAAITAAIAQHRKHQS